MPFLLEITNRDEHLAGTRQAILAKDDREQLGDEGNNIAADISSVARILRDDLVLSDLCCF